MIKSKKTENNFCDALQKAISYLEQRFDFSDSSTPSVLQIFSLKSMPTFQNIKKACDELKLAGNQCIGMDALYDEFSSSKDALQQSVKSNKTAAEKWQQFFNLAKEVKLEVPNLFQLVSYVMSIPGSNALPERIFSLMNAKWRSDRNRMTVNLVKAELQVFANYEATCKTFYAQVIADQKLLDAAAGNAKYVWKKKTRPIQ